MIDFQENWKNRGYQTAVIAAPIEMDGERYLMGAVIRRESGDARFYVHEILTTKEGQAPFKTGTDSKAGGKSGGDYPSVISLLQKVKNINSNSESSPTRYSLDDDDTDIPGMDEQRDSKFSQFSDAYEGGTHLVGKSQGVQIAAALKKEYSSSVNTQELATKYRQMSSVAERLAELNFGMVTDGGASSVDIGAEYSQVYNQLMEMGREVADTIIDNIHPLPCWPVRDRYRPEQLLYRPC